MDDSEISTLDQVRQFLEGTNQVGITIPSKAVCYDWVRRVLVRFKYLSLRRSERGILLLYLCRVTGYSSSSGQSNGSAIRGDRSD